MACPQLLGLINDGYLPVHSGCDLFPAMTQHSNFIGNARLAQTINDPLHHRLA